MAADMAMAVDAVPIMAVVMASVMAVAMAQDTAVDMVPAVALAVDMAPTSVATGHFTIEDVILLAARTSLSNPHLLRK
ncbi:Hypothetical predicted protein [Lynx pardinus]|uniref:Secreted protein n=1 Tax=Lynx pardinus TaxID=191816 RepID=A0A485NB74_LYNPA|nr:Hypothetical predicted protein [Lynx pardinus]